MKSLGTVLVATLVTSAVGCHPGVNVQAPMSPLHCLAGEEVAWVRAPYDPRLDQWCAQTGSPVVIAAPVDDDERAIAQLQIVSWNVHVGGGQVVELVESLRAASSGRGRESGLVLLLQEAYRSGGDIPAASAGGGVPKRIQPGRSRLDVVALSRRLGLSLAYVPSMRNGREPTGPYEDRGVAVLSTERLTDLVAIELPFARQRRVALAATVHPRGALSLRVVSAHLDTLVVGPGQRRQAAALATQLDMARAAGVAPMLAGVDTNARTGERDPTIAILASALPRLDCGGRPSPIRPFHFDFMFSDIEPARVRRCQTLPDSRGSDHRPLLLDIDLAAGAKGFPVVTPDPRAMPPLLH